MKPYAKLTRANFEQSPIWEWVSEDDASHLSEAVDESYVRPTALLEIPNGSFAQFIVTTSVELRNGDHMLGIAEVTVAGRVVSVQPTTLFLLDRHLQIPGVETNRLITRYTESLENYPVAWRLLVSVHRESCERSGEIKGGDMKDIVAYGVLALLTLKALREK